jgi:hypothetical protein
VSRSPCRSSCSGGSGAAGVPKPRDGFDSAVGCIRALRGNPSMAALVAATHWVQRTACRGSQRQDHRIDVPNVCSVFGATGPRGRSGHAAWSRRRLAGVISYRRHALRRLQAGRSVPQQSISRRLLLPYVLPGRQTAQAHPEKRACALVESFGSANCRQLEVRRWRVPAGGNHLCARTGRISARIESP